jgi:RNA 3'-terminal phosphate cyclase
MILFHNDTTSRDFYKGLQKANEILADIGIELDYSLIKGGFYPNGEYPYTITVEKIKELKDDKQLDLL